MLLNLPNLFTFKAPSVSQTGVYYEIDEKQLKLKK